MDPFIKTGGLADVIGSLPKAFVSQIQIIEVFIPYYRDIARENYSVTKTSFKTKVKIGAKSYTGRIYSLQQDEFKINFIDNYKLFRNRSQLYVRDGKDYPDNLERFTFFCKCALEAVKHYSKKESYDILHCHDWQTALIPLYVKLDDFFLHRRPLLVYTIHNLAYQGKFPRSKFNVLGITKKSISSEYLESWGKINLMKAGIIFADEITTVSPTYAQEIQTEKWGAGLHRLLMSKRDNLTGIMNGVEYDIWNTENNAHLLENYSLKDLSGKSTCKKYLQEYFHLSTSPSIPILGVVSRLAWQKGMDLILEVLNELIPTTPLQFVLLGTGDLALEKQFLDLQDQFPDQIGVKIGFGQALAHQIEAGSDIFLMPSRYEPCGLNQLYSLRYGTVPIVHSTGGLADSVIDYQTNPKEGTGFIFDEYQSIEFKQAILNALKLFQDKTKWIELMKRGMEKDFSWSNSAKRYLDVYNKRVP
jgi:starch synthase